MKPFRNMISVILMFSGVLISSVPVIAQPLTVAFRDHEAKSVSIYGSFDNWQKKHTLVRGRTGLWDIKLDVPKGRVEYIFLIDGKWQINPLISSVADGFGGRNNVIIVR